MKDRSTANTGTAQATQSRKLVVRFAHIDAAGIVFYPRYLEMLAQAFPEVAPAEQPFTLAIQFRKPTPLGTCLTLALAAPKRNEAWELAGLDDDDEQFSMTWRPQNSVPLGREDHEPDRPAFMAEPIRIEDWAAGPGARLQVSRYYEFVNAAVEQWFEHELGLPFSRLHEDRAGIPTVSLRTLCAELPRKGEDTVVWIRPGRIGRSSVQFDSWLVGSRGCMARTSQTVVFVRLGQRGFQSEPLPEALRSQLRRHLAETVQT